MGYTFLPRCFTPRARSLRILLSFESLRHGQTDLTEFILIRDIFFHLLFLVLIGWPDIGTTDANMLVPWLDGHWTDPWERSGLVWTGAWSTEDILKWWLSLYLCSLLQLLDQLIHLLILILLHLELTVVYYVCFVFNFKLNLKYYKFFANYLFICQQYLRI